MAASKKAAKKSPAKKTAKKAAKKTPAKKAAKKPPAKKAVKVASKKAPAKKAPAKKTVKKTPIKAAVKKGAAKKAPAKKPVAKKAASVKPAKTVAKPAPTKAANKKPIPAKKPAAAKQKLAEKKLKPKTTSSKASVKQPVKSNKPVTTASAEKPAEKKPTIAAARRPVRKPLIKPTPDSVKFKVGQLVVYPAHGVGRIAMVEKQEILGDMIEFYVVKFAHEKMILRVPKAKAGAQGMRPLSEPKEIDTAIILLQGRARVKRTMWSRRAQEYEAKINSGSLTQVAEVVRDLFRAPEQPEQSYSERQLYEIALDRMAREVSAVRKSEMPAAVEELLVSLGKKQIAA